MNGDFFPRKLSRLGMGMMRGRGERGWREGRR